MSWYRNKYLRSEDWKNLRLATIAIKSDGIHCNLCREKVTKFDVHHFQYRKLYDVQVDDLEVLCRRCHKLVHAFLERYPEIKLLCPEYQWKEIRKKLQYKPISEQWLAKRQRVLEKRNGRFPRWLGKADKAIAQPEINRLKLIAELEGREQLIST